MNLERVYREPHLKLQPSQVFRGVRVRPVYRTEYPRPANESFQEFLIYFLQVTFGPEWWNQQVATRLEDQHIVLRWAAEVDRVCEEYSKGAAPREARVAISSGPMYALLMFAYDVFCLRSIDRFPLSLLERLKHRDRFQGALYEVAVAAIMARAGFIPNFCHPNANGSKICEFIAADRHTTAKIAVEAKSRIRTGAFNERGEFESQVDVDGIRRLFRRAIKQAPAGLPFVVFLDINLPVDPNGTIEQDFFNTFLGFVQTVTHEHANSVTAIAITNFAFHFGKSLAEVLPPCNRLLISKGKAPALKPKVLARIERATRLYGNIPTAL